LSLGGKISLWLARKRTTSRFSFFIGTMSRRQVKGAPVERKTKNVSDSIRHFRFLQFDLPMIFRLLVFLIVLDC
jgi:hypothetical protein